MNKIRENLWLCDIQDVQTKDTSRYDTVVGICQDNVAENLSESISYHHFPLSDGPPHPNAKNPGEFNYELFEGAVETIIDAVENEETTLVHCHVAQSRSVMACTAALVILEDISFDEAFWQVKSARGTVNPSDELYLFGTRYVTRSKISDRNE